jgi:hypothetical protein
MRKWLALFAGVAALTAFAPASSLAQGVGIDLPGVGVRIGEPYHHHYGYTWRDEPRVYQRPAWREREVYLSDRRCRTVTIHEDGFTRRIRRCFD